MGRRLADVRGRAPDGEHRTGRGPHHALGHRAEDRVGEAAPPVRADDDEADRVLARELGDRLRFGILAFQAPDLPCGKSAWKSGSRRLIVICRRASLKGLIGAPAQCLQLHRPDTDFMVFCDDRFDNRNKL